MSEVPALRRSVAILRHLSGSNRPVSAGALVRALDSPQIWTVAAPVVDHLDRPVAAIGLSDTMREGEAPDLVREAEAARAVRRAAAAVTARLRA